MNWDAVGAIGETVGAIAVVVTLIYLAFQIRQQNRESRIASVHELNEAFRASISAFQDPGLADVFSRAKSDFADLGEPERLRFIAMVQGVFRVWEDAFYQFDAGRLDPRIWQAMVTQFSAYLSLPGVQRVWEIRKRAYNAAFRDLVDRTTPIEYLTK
ncbi:MAG TPA: hypothetical protein VML95_00665 [Longimicrobiales bacterium]|nr:hypothetical protein [Longimicrobiales bacterium]